MTAQLSRRQVEWLRDAATEFASTQMKMTMKPEEVLQLTTALLAGMDSEPVAWVTKADLEDKATISTPAYPSREDGEERTVFELVPLYAAPPAQQPELTVWYGSMPETNGKANWTAVLHRKGECMSTGITIDRSEYPDRVRYEADRMRYLIGQFTDEPDIMAYDENAHSGYVKPPAPMAVTDVCDGNEQDAFEKWASGDGMDLTKHPLHWLFLDGKTATARKAWKAAIKYCRAAMLKAGPVTAATVPDGWTSNCDADAALVMLDRIDTIDCADDERIESVKNIIRRLAAAPEQEV